jgi:glycosyltransferase involved in cell wall biosynthesis
MQDWTEWVKDKRIVFFVAETLPSVAGSGIGAFNFASFLNNYKCKTSIICYNYNNRNISQEIIEQVEIKRVTYYNKNIVTKIISFPWLVLNYYRFISSCDIAVVYGKYLVGFELILLFAIIKKKISIFRSTFLGDDDIESLRSNILWPIRKFIFSRICGYYAINNLFTRFWKKSIQAKVEVLEACQGVNIQRFYPKYSNQNMLRIEYSIPNNCIVFLSCGILVERKGYREIIDALNFLKYPFVYIIVGQYYITAHHKSSREELSQMNSIYTFGKSILGERIKFIGNTASIEDFYNSSDYFIHGSFAEGTPNVLLEAMACDIPIICRKLSGISEEIIKSNENCLEYSNKLELINLLESLPYREEELKNFSKAALKKATEFYSFESITEKFVKWLQLIDK